MKLKCDYIEPDLIEYLLSQKEMVKDATLYEDGGDSVIDIKFNPEYKPKDILRAISLYNKRDYIFLLEFDKEIDNEFNSLTYKLKDPCCEYCYSGFVRDLFYNDNIYSVKSKGSHNEEITVTYSIDYKEEDLLKYIKEHE